MTDAPKESPKRAAYKAAEVCEIAHIQPYVLRSWESEFPKLGVLRAGARIYRQSDLDQVLRIKQLVFEEGLTLAGARRRIEEENGQLQELPIEEFVTPEMRQRIGRVKDGLRQVLTILGPAQEPAGAVDAANADDSDVLRLRPADSGGDGNAAASMGRRRAKTGEKKAAHRPRTTGGRASGSPRSRGRA